MQRAGRKTEHRRTRGFTLIETVGAVAILAILMSIAIPAVVLLQRNLYMAKLDDYARQIFLAAQDEMSSMKASGRLDYFMKAVDQQVEEKPADFPETDNDAWRDLFIVYSQDDAGQNFLVRANESLAKATENGGYFLLEVNPLSGDVYSAFYSEEPFTYEQITNGLSASRARSVRAKLEPRLGYYGGGSSDFGVVGMPSEFEPQVDLVNGEELYVSVSCRNMMALRRTQQYLKMTITVDDQDESTAPYVMSYRGGYDFFVVNDTIQMNAVVDSLEEENAFRRTGLRAGDDLTVTAELTYEDRHNDVNIQGTGSVSGVNSLFDSIGEDGTIRVSKVRHLNNLRQSIYAPGTKTANVVQTQTISFFFDDWDKKDYCSDWTANPLDHFTPIGNESFFYGGSYDGGTQEIRGFPFQGGASGLFDTLSSATLKNIRLTDCSSSGALAGTLAGSLTNCTVENCGVYLNTKDRNDAYYANMEQRRQDYTVKSSQAAGGLVGQAENTTFTECFAAIDVTGSQYVGGLAGKLTGCTVERGYASGDVTCSGRYGGGLVGLLENSSRVNGCYATGDVTSESYGGGLIGRVNAGRAVNCVAYGKVTNQAGSEDTGTSGGLAGASSTNASFQNCSYLKQGNYNSNYKPQRGVSAVSYGSLRDQETHVGESFPYSDGLRGLGFPFRLIQRGTAGAMPHYGDWPEAYQLQTSLVYYEKYADGEYRYYARTSLTSGGESVGDNWVVNSLRDEECIEDGYALMTIYVLNSFDYDLDTGVTGQAHERATVSVVQSEDGARSDQAVLIAENVKLVFQDQNQGSQAETTISNAKVYRLPFKLQINDRLWASTFWETLKITGYNKAHSSEPLFQDETFYYCPDFAKNAVNPSVGSSSGKPAEPNGEDVPVYVRSARQLNGLSRSTAYWNSYYGGESQIVFLQETDVNFGTYTTNYCGVEYDLMDTSGPYSNQPIGRPNVIQGGGDLITNNFRNCYDGQGHKIIDYRCEVDDYRFTGMFGEVEKCTLKNIVMVASDPEKETGYVCSRYKYQNNDEAPGVGALVGLLYVDINYKAGERVATIENCSVSGYTVRYNSSINMDYAVGGLVGFCFGYINNCSAVNNLYGDTTNWSRARIGGIVGSLNGFATVKNCYAGGTINVITAGQVAGISGGHRKIWGYGGKGSNSPYNEFTIENCYSFCTLKRPNIVGGDRGVGWIFGITVPEGLKDDYGFWVHVNNCYYLTDTVQSGLINTTDGVKNAEANGTPVNYAQLRAMALTWLNSDHTVAVSQPWSAALAGQSYPFPGMVKDMAGQYVHYGDWPQLARTYEGEDQEEQTEP